MVNPNRFYTYAYLREDRTPYYIGKGQGKRLYKKSKDEVGKPKDKSRIIFLKQNLTEQEAFRHEKYMIAVFGRKDLGTGILRNKTNGGDGSSGCKYTEERREKIKGENNPFYGKTHSEEIKEKIRQSKLGENNPNYGKSHSEENRRKMSEKKKGKFKGKNNPNYGKRGKNSPNYGKKWWNDRKGNNKFCLECPGENWVVGRGKLKNIIGALYEPHTTP
jgi:hypothetical protein